MHQPHLEHGGTVVRQVDQQASLSDATARQPATEPALLTDQQAAALLGVSERTFATFVATADWLPTPLALAKRLRRWHRGELMEALSRAAPRGQRGSEPEQLRRARIERQKASGVPA